MTLLDDRPDDDRPDPEWEYEGEPVMIPCAFLTEAAAWNLGARPGWPNNPPKPGIYILTRDTRRTFYLPADRCLSAEIRPS